MTRKNRLGHIHVLLIASLLALCLTPESSRASGHGFGTSNQATLARNFALPPLARPKNFSGNQDWWRLSAELVTEYFSARSANERFLLDGEVQSYEWSFQRRLRPDFLAGLELNVIHASGGFMDGIVEDWHDWLGLPDGGRTRAPRNAYRYFYSRDGNVALDERDGFTSVNDLELTFAYKPGPRWSVQTMLKLPLASRREALVAQALGAAMWAEYSVSAGPSWPLNASLSAGLSVSENVGALSMMQNRLIPLGGLGLSAAISKTTSVVSHLYLHGPLFKDSRINALTRPGAQLALGLRWCGSSSYCYELLFHEDLAVASSPDFSLQFAVIRK